MGASEYPVCRQLTKHIVHGRSAAFRCVSLAVIVRMKDIAEIVHPLLLLFPPIDRNEPNELVCCLETDSEILVSAESRYRIVIRPRTICPADGPDLRGVADAVHDHDPKEMGR